MDQLYYGTQDFSVTEFRQRKVIDEIRMLMTAFDCMIPDNAAIYCSSDVTTGKLLYELYQRCGTHSNEELKEKLGASEYKRVLDDLVEKNIERGKNFTEKIRQRGHFNLINPGPLKAPGFDQEHYLYLWEWVIIRKAYEAQFNESWEYSNGCTLEYAIATRKNIPRLDHVGNIIELDQAVQQVERAVADLRGRGIQTTRLEQHLALIKEQRS